ncbi:PrpF domain-containing protein [Salirhabdus salicampi]|uniref:PrpF domain-containing protein n=1 Tax=Salirhabdus salicampi TaxID=476102 RepID=UPI0020C1D792|nr:PrpF domain-containing protein [Salirhabdus salicampi]MCP8616324.1 PrpF protein [Salirhabdus salicampi]
MSQFKVPCSVYRGGTSRGLFFHKKDLPDNIEQQNHIFLTGIDAYNSTQVDGLGGGNSHTSKVVVISPPSVDGVDIDYTFYQIGVGEEIVDDNGTCGNLMAAVGAFAIEEKLVKVEDDADQVDVTVYNTNIEKIISLTVPVENGNAKVEGDYKLQGLTKPGAKYLLNINEPGGGKTGKTLSLGPRQKVTTKKATYDVSFVDIVNPTVFVSSTELGIKGVEPNHELSNNQELLEELEAIRCDISVKAGMAQSIEEAHQAPAIPKIGILSEPQDYVTSEGRLIKGNEVDIVVKMLSMGRFHRTSPASCLYNIASSTLLRGTVPNQMSSFSSNSYEQTVRIGHPEGIVEVRVRLTEDGQDIAFVGLDRTARKILKGELYVPTRDTDKNIS